VWMEAAEHEVRAFDNSAAVLGFDCRTNLEDGLSSVQERSARPMMYVGIHLLIIAVLIRDTKRMGL
jgi:hypothetical protein